MAAESISFGLIAQIREIYTMAYQEIALDQRKQKGDNGYTDRAISAYILAVAAVESFVNETLLGPGMLIGSLGSLSETELKGKRESKLQEKLIDITQLAFGQPVFDKGARPYQDMDLLISVRNTFVHYKMGLEPEHQKLFRSLLQKGIAINSTDGFWANALCTFDGIWWAHNTTLRVIREILNTAQTTKRHPILMSMATNTSTFFDLIPERDDRHWGQWMSSNIRWGRIVTIINSQQETDTNTQAEGQSASESPKERQWR